MAYQNPAFYFYNLLRDVGESALTEVPTVTQKMFPLFDSRLGELFKFETNYTTDPVKEIRVNRGTADALRNAVDTLILSGHNMNGNSVRVFSTDTSGGTIVGELLPVVDVSAANGVTEKFDMTADTRNFLVWRSQISSGADNITELSELWLSIKRELVRGPEPNWNHSWRRTQRSFVNDAGVSSTLLVGAARKTHTLTWRHLFGADRQIMLDMREQTDDWSQPFWFLPPDSDLLGVDVPQLVELDRDANWIQDFLNPLVSGTSDRVTLPMIQVLG